MFSGDALVSPGFLDGEHTRVGDRRVGWDGWSCDIWISIVGVIVDYILVDCVPFGWREENPCPASGVSSRDDAFQASEVADQCLSDFLDFCSGWVGADRVFGWFGFKRESDFGDSGDSGDHFGVFGSKWLRLGFDRV